MDTKPEVLVRSVAHRLGFRFRKNVRTLPGKPDLVLKKHRSVIFVHGCFWHRHEGCRRSNLPKSNQQYWRPKLERNVARDIEHVRELEALGWRVLVIWECEAKNVVGLKRLLSNFLLDQN